MATDPLLPPLPPRLARWWHSPLWDYAAALYAPSTAHAASALPEGAVFWEALRAESRRVTGAEDAAEAVWQHRVVATAHHTTPTNGPGFFAADRLATASGASVVVLAWSGVSLSNTAWSGCLVAADLDRVLRPGSPTAQALRRARADRQRDAGAGEDRLWLFPARQRDDLLYRLPLPERLASGALHADLLPAAADLLLPAAAAAAEDYPTWALRTCAAIQRRALGHEALTYLDASRIVADCLQRDPALRRLLLHRAPLRERFAEETWLYGRHQQRLIPLRPAPGGFAGRGGAVFVPDEEVHAGLVAGQLCPGLVPAFLLLRCVVGLRCLGSFHQEEYLRRFVQGWRDLGHAAAEEEDDAPSLIMGRLRDAGGQEVHPLDCALQHRALPPPGTVGDLWAPLLTRLGYSLPPSALQPG